APAPITTPPFSDVLQEEAVPTEYSTTVWFISFFGSLEAKKIPPDAPRSLSTPVKVIGLSEVPTAFKEPSFLTQKLASLSKAIVTPGLIVTSSGIDIPLQVTI